MELPVVAIVGRVNVGKSSLFNRLIGGRTAIVDNEAGVTRDRKIGTGEWGGVNFIAVDTGGLSPGSDDPFQNAIVKQVHLAVQEAQVIVVLVDGTEGVHPFDEAAVELVRKSGLPCLLAVNKIDSAGRLGLEHEFNALGLGKPWPVSAAHGLGVGDLLDEIVRDLPVVENPDFDGISVAVIGRPNVGKSSIVNRLLDDERNIVTPVAGTTRDSIDSYITLKETSYRLIDTAGLRRKSRKMEDIEFYSTLRSWKSVGSADVVVVVLDGNEYPTTQDLRLATKAWEMGKGLLICVNKVDLGLDRHLWIRSVVQRFPLAKWIPIFFTSALKGRGMGRLLPMVQSVAERRKTTISTGKLNKIMRVIVNAVQPPSPKGKMLKFFYITQVKDTPPVVVVFVSRADLLPENYKSYFENRMHEELNMNGVPLKIVYRNREH
jgi:GTP-binding protein